MARRGPRRQVRQLHPQHGRRFPPKRTQGAARHLPHRDYGRIPEMVEDGVEHLARARPDAVEEERRTEDAARDKGLTEIQGLVLSHNPSMLKLMRRLGFEVRAYPDDPEFKLVAHQL